MFFSGHAASENFKFLLLTVTHDIYSSKITYLYPNRKSENYCHLKLTPALFLNNIRIHSGRLCLAKLFTKCVMIDIYFGL